jgi:hypothetical protein
MILKRIGEAIAVVYILGYWYYLLSTLYLAWPNLTWFNYGPFAVVQAIISILWPLWLWLEYRPLMP